MSDTVQISVLTASSAFAVVCWRCKHLPKTIKACRFFAGNTALQHLAVQHLVRKPG
jgi:hypothetical protein